MFEVHSSKRVERTVILFKTYNSLACEAGNSSAAERWIDLVSLTVYNALEHLFSFPFQTSEVFPLVLSRILVGELLDHCYLLGYCSQVRLV